MIRFIIRAAKLINGPRNTFDNETDIVAVSKGALIDASRSVSWMSGLSIATLVLAGLGMERFVARQRDEYTISPLQYSPPWNSVFY
jgi:hypothetical protein